MFTIKVNLDLGELEDALERLMDAGHDMTPLTRNISEIMYDATARAFQAEQSPDGKKWAPLTALTLSRRKGRGKILAPTGGASGLRCNVSIGCSPSFNPVKLEVANNSKLDGKKGEQPQECQTYGTRSRRNGATAWDKSGCRGGR